MITDTGTRARWSQLRLRQTKHRRDLIAETSFSVDQLIQPVFVVESAAGAEPIAGLGENARLGTAEALEVIERDVDAGVDVVQLASMFWLRLQTGAPVRSVEAIPEGQSAWYRRFFHSPLRRGVYLPPSGFEVCFVSLAHDRETLTAARDALVTSAEEARVT